MHAIHSGEFPGESAVVFMPMMNMDPTDMSCIYSTLDFISQQAKKYEATPLVTFDQPLWWKAVSSGVHHTDHLARPISESHTDPLALGK